MNVLLAQYREAGGPSSWSFVHIAVVIVIVAAVCGVVMIALRKFGVQIPDWLWQIIVICVVAAVAITAIYFLAQLVW